MWTLWNKIYNLKNSFWKFYELRLILGLLAMYFDAVVVSIYQELFSFIQIGSGHTVCPVTEIQKSKSWTEFLTQA